MAELVTSEFFEQGDRERAELKLTPTVSTNLKTSLLNKQMFYSEKKTRYSEICFTRLPGGQRRFHDVLKVSLKKRNIFTECKGPMM